MPSIIFYRSNEHHHPASNDPDILFVNNEQDLHQGIRDSNHTRPIVCLCCPDPIPTINRLPPDVINVIIYLCRFHSGSVNLPNVREDVTFEQGGNWKFEVILNRIQHSGINGNQQENEADILILRNIIQQDAHRSQVSIQDQLSGTLVGNDIGEEAEDD